MKNQASNEQATNAVDLLELFYKVSRVLKISISLANLKNNIKNLLPIAGL